jgi:hypothetical protein
MLMAQERRDVVITGDAEAWAQTRHRRARLNDSDLLNP